MMSIALPARHTSYNLCVVFALHARPQRYCPSVFVLSSASLVSLPPTPSPSPHLLFPVVNIDGHHCDCSLLCGKGMEHHTYSAESVGFEFKRTKVNPEVECLLTDPISVSVEFTSKVDQGDVEIELQFIADCANKKVATKLAACLQRITVGTNNISFTEVPFTLPQDMDKNVLPNIALISIFIRSGDTDLGRISMVADIKLKDNKFYRTVYNSLE